MDQIDIRKLAREMLTALDSGSLVAPPTRGYPDLDFAAAYKVAAEEIRLRRYRGERPVGRKVGYTNRNIWEQYDVHEPIWGNMYKHTVHFARENSAVCSLSGMIAPRIEPEIAFQLSAPLPLGCDDPAVILRSVEWMARTFEIVDCHYTDWKFRGPDSVVDFSHHAALIVGEPAAVREASIPGLVDQLRDCRVTLLRNGETVDSGVGSNALGHPALVLGLLADVIDMQPEAEPLTRGEIITTGTLTAAVPVKAGETWCTEVDGLALPSLTLSLK
jgi:2-oxo-3-hexenedioate decarboxylase